MSNVLSQINIIKATEEVKKNDISKCFLSSPQKITSVKSEQR